MNAAEIVQMVREGIESLPEATIVTLDRTNYQTILKAAQVEGCGIPYRKYPIETLCGLEINKLVVDLPDHRVYVSSTKNDVSVRRSASI